MSKKIIIPLKNIRCYLHDLFHEYLESQYELERTTRMSYYDEDDWDDESILWAMQNGFIFDGYDPYEEIGNDDGELLYPRYSEGNKRKKDKRNDDDAYAEFWERMERKQARKEKRKHKKSKARVIDITTPYSGDEESPMELGDDDGILNGKEIYYYPDYNDKNSRLEFTTLQAFSDFCDDNGFVVPPYVGEQIAYRRRSHACLRPEARDEGIFEIMAEESYGDMVYEAVPITELNQ